MLQPVLRSVKSLGRSICIRQCSIQCRTSGAASLTLSKKNKSFSVPSRQYHHPTEPNVVSSFYDDIVVPNCMVSDFVWHGLDRWADKTAVVCGITGKGYTYAQAHKMSTAFAACLRNKLKLRDGDCIAVMLPNSPEYPLAVLGAVQAGCIVSTINPIYMAEEVERQLQNSHAKAIVTTAECFPQVKIAINALGKSMPIIIAECETRLPHPEGTIKFAEFAENFGENTDCLREVRRSGDDTVFLPYSSGTTGLPKGVELTHKNITANCIQMNSQKIAIVLPTTENHQDVTICILPFFHIYGLVVTLLSRLACGMKLVTVPKFQPDTFLSAQERYQASVLFLVPPIVLFMGSYHEVKNIHLDPIRTVMSGAAPLAATDVNRFLEKTKSNVAFMQGYGLTETSPVVLMQERGSPNYASVGTPTPSTDAQIVSLEDESKVLGPNEVGELWLRGPQVMKGYYNNPAATEEIFRPNGWMRTGDMAYYDDNHAFYITDRLKELIKVKGYQVPPAELEGVLRSHPDVIEAVVIGAPHPAHGEVPQAYVVKKNNSNPSEESILKYVNEKVANYKRISTLKFVDSVPKNASGKILRREVKKMYLD